MNLATCRPDEFLARISPAIFAVLFHAQTIAEAGSIGVGDIAAQMQSSHKRLLELRGGWGVRYHVAVEQDPHRGTFAFTAIDGAFRVKWPKLYCYIRGPGFVIRESHREVMIYEREAVYDFATQTSVARNRDVLVQIAPYRHAWAAKYAFPLLFQYFAESSQFYVPGAGVATSAGEIQDYWIPESLRKDGYVVFEDKMVDDVVCVLVERPRHDRVWVAPAFNFGLVRREIYRDRDSALCERTINNQWQEIAPDVWLPMRQVYERYDLGTSHSENGSLDHRLTLTVNQLRTGDLTDQDFEIPIPDGAEVDDEINGLLYRKLPHGGNPAERGLSNARRLLQEHRSLATVATSRIPFLVLANLALLLAVATLVVWRHRRSEKSEKTGVSPRDDVE